MAGSRSAAPRPARPPINLTRRAAASSFWAVDVRGVCRLPHCSPLVAERELVLDGLPLSIRTFVRYSGSVKLLISLLSRHT